MTALTESAERAAEFNALNPVGTQVHYWLTIRHGEPFTGRIMGPALARGAYHPGPVVVVAGDNEGPRSVPLSLVEPIRTKVVDPCALCRHPKADHRIRYVALEGDHEWRDPYARSIANTTPKPADIPEPETRCDCGPGEFCARCDPWHEPRPAAEAARPPAPVAPGPFARIYDAARRAA